MTLILINEYVKFQLLQLQIGSKQQRVMFLVQIDYSFLAVDQIVVLKIHQ